MHDCPTTMCLCLCLCVFECVCVPVFVNSRLYVCLCVPVCMCVPAKACNLNCKLTDVAPPSRMHMCVCIHTHTHTVTELRRRSNGTIKFKWNQEKKNVEWKFLVSVLAHPKVQHTHTDTHTHGPPHPHRILHPHHPVFVWSFVKFGVVVCGQQPASTGVSCVLIAKQLRLFNDSFKYRYRFN